MIALEVVSHVLPGGFAGRLRVENLLVSCVLRLPALLQAALMRQTQL